MWDRASFHHEVAYALPWKDQLVPELEDSNVPVHCLGTARLPTMVTRLRALVRDVGATIVHAHLPTTGIAARLAGAAPVIYTEHNLAGSYRLPVRVANRLTYGRNSAVIAVSPAVAASLAGYPGPGPVVVPNGVSVSVSDEDIIRVREELDLRERKLVVQVGNIRPGKGHATLARAACLLRAGDQSPVVVSVGAERSPGELGRVLGDVDASGVRFVGRRDDALAFLAAADVVVNPSDVEGLPLAVLEAMALARPVVATAVGGVADLIRDGDTGKLVGPGDSRALADAVTELLVDPEGASRLGTRARELIEDEYRLDKMVSRVENVYREVLSG